jgi:hypothetical protein
MPSNPDSINERNLQVDATGDSPWDEPLNKLTEGAKIAAVFIVETGKDDKLAALWRDGADLRIRDETNPGTGGAGYTLTQLLSGGSGITEGQHDVLDDLVHWLAETNYQEVVRAGGKVTNVINWTDSGKTTKIREMVITRTAGKVSQLDFIQYDGAGVEKQRMTGVITRTAGKVSSIQWTETGS